MSSVWSRQAISKATRPSTDPTATPAPIVSGGGQYNSSKDCPDFI